MPAVQMSVRQLLPRVRSLLRRRELDEGKASVRPFRAARAALSRSLPGQTHTLDLAEGLEQLCDVLPLRLERQVLHRQLQRVVPVRATLDSHRLAAHLVALRELDVDRTLHQALTLQRGKRPLRSLRGIELHEAIALRRVETDAVDALRVAGHNALDEPLEVLLLDAEGDVRDVQRVRILEDVFVRVRLCGGGGGEGNRALVVGAVVLLLPRHRRGLLDVSVVLQGAHRRPLQEERDLVEGTEGKLSERNLCLLRCDEAHQSDGRLLGCHNLLKSTEAAEQRREIPDLRVLRQVLHKDDTVGALARAVFVCERGEVKALVSEDVTHLCGQVGFTHGKTGRNVTGVLVNEAALLDLQPRSQRPSDSVATHEQRVPPVRVGLLGLLLHFLQLLEGALRLRLLRHVVRVRGRRIRRHHAPLENAAAYAPEGLHGLLGDGKLDKGHTLALVGVPRQRDVRLGHDAVLLAQRAHLLLGGRVRQVAQEQTPALHHLVDDLLVRLLLPHPVRVALLRQRHARRAARGNPAGAVDDVRRLRPLRLLLLGDGRGCGPGRAARDSRGRRCLVAVTAAAAALLLRLLGQRLLLGAEEVKVGHGVELLLPRALLLRVDGRHGHRVVVVAVVAHGAVVAVVGGVCAGVLHVVLPDLPARSPLGRLHEVAQAPVLLRLRLLPQRLLGAQACGVRRRLHALRLLLLRRKLLVALLHLPLRVATPRLALRRRVADLTSDLNRQLRRVVVRVVQGADGLLRLRLRLEAEESHAGASVLGVQDDRTVGNLAARTEVCLQNLRAHLSGESDDADARAARRSSSPAAGVVAGCISLSAAAHSG
eukprot:Rhum_TRINITY_DN14385_c29_g1::Rhum_TRINITY_DN14385_c29_g1_i1::g.86236::m.86236